MVPFDRQLQNGDMVEIITKRSSQPKPAWMDMVVTGHAREKLRSQLKKTS
jgi:(p)ppGpp synthase/HD superfamily hydrolase